MNIIVLHLCFASMVEVHYLYCYSQPTKNPETVPGGLLLASIDPIGYAIGNAYNLKGKITEQLQYAEDGESHIADGHGTWKFTNLTPRRRYEVFVTWTGNQSNTSQAVFSGYNENKNEAEFSATLSQKSPPQRHLVGSLNQKDDYQSVGLITAESGTVLIKAVTANSSHGRMTGGKVRLLEVETLASYCYDNNDHLIAQTDSNGIKTEFVYNALGQQIKTIRADGQITENFYDYAGRKVYQKDHHGIVYGSSFDTTDRVIEEFYFEPTVTPIDISFKNKNQNKIEWVIPNLEPAKRYELLASWKFSDKNAVSAKFTVNNNGENILIRNIDLTTFPGIHPIAGNGYRSIGAFSVVAKDTKVVLESDGNVSAEGLKVVEIESLARYQFDHEGNLIASTDQLGNTTHYEYDKLGRRIKIISLTTDQKQHESVTEIIYDQAGNVWKQIDPYSYITENVYNPFGEVIKTIRTDDDYRGTVRNLMTMNLYDNSGRLIEITDPAGNKTNYKYDIQGCRIETVNALGHSMKVEYDKKGRIVAETNAAGHRTIYRYNPKGQRIAAILPKPDENSESLVIRQFYHRSGQLIGNIAPDGVVHSYLADKFGRNTAAYLGILLEKPTRTIDGKAVYSFDHILPNENYDIFITWKRMEKTEKENTVRIVDILNATITEHYNSKIDLSVSCKNDSFLVPFCSLPFKRLGNNIEPKGNTIEVEWTGDTKNVAVYLLRSKPISRILYNEKGQVQSQVDARDHSIIYTYDHFGRQISAIRDGDENSCCSEGKTFYNKKRQVIAKLALDGRLSLLKYDMLGRQECSYLGAMVESKFGSYKLEGLPIGEEFDLYVSDSSQKDGETLQLGDMTLVKERTFKAEKSTLSGKLNGAGTVVLVRKLPVQQTKYDFTGRTIKTIDAKQNETLLSYDSLGRQIAVFQPAANNTRLAAHSYYDESGHVVAQAVVPVDAESLKIKGEKRVTRMEYDKLGRAVKTIQPNPNGQKDQNEEIVQRQEYDSSRNVIRKIDPLGYETKFEYNSLNQKISETSAEGGVTKYTYDSAGRMKSLTDPVNNTTSWTYNLIERIAGEHVILEGIQRDRLFFYDASGNIVSKVDRNGRITEWTFDKLNRHTSEVWYDNYESWLLQKTLKKFVTTYNRSGKIASVEDGDNRFVFSYGVFSNEIKQVQTLAGLQKPIEFNYATDIIGLKTETVLKVGNEVDYKNHYEFDSLGRKIKISQVSERAPLKLVNVSYNEFGKLTQQSRFEDNKPVAETKNSYDNLGRLVNISHTNGNNIFADYDILWDAGNRITDFDFTYLNGPPKKKSRYEYDKTSQLIGAKYDFMENEVYKYDTNGNRLNAEIQGQNQSYKTGEYNRLLSNNHDRFEYDAEGNRTSKTSNNGGVTKYSWDNRNRLVKVETPTNTVEYIYDYQNRLVKRTEKSSEMNFIHDGWQIVRQFENGSPTHRYLWGTKQDELLCDNNNWTLGDHLNTIRDIVAMDSGVVLHLEYNAFGKLLAKSINPVDFAYTGKLTDPASGLPWNINRWYDNTVGNWISEDPIGFVAKDTNLIRFVMNQPVKFIDPNGQDIRLKKGIPNQPGPVGLIHQDICVDTWEVNGEKIGERCFSFGRENPKLKWYKTTTSWLGFIGIIPAGCGFQGTIYESTNPGNTVSTHATTQAEDVQWLTFMLGRVGTKDRYTVLRLNCVHYTNLEFAAAVLRFP